jgi:hypothetical protein
MDNADDERIQEARVRGMADLMGYTISQSSTRKDRLNTGGYMVLLQGFVVLGDKFEAGLDEIEAFLKGEGAQWVSGKASDEPS